MDLITKLKSLLKPRSASSQSPAATLNSDLIGTGESFRYDRGTIKTELQLSQPRREEFEKRKAQIQSLHAGATETAMKRYDQEWRQIIQDRDGSLGRATLSFRQSLRDLYLEFSKADQAPAGQITMASITTDITAGRRRQPIKADPIPDKLGDVIAEKRESTN